MILSVAQNAAMRSVSDYSPESDITVFGICILTFIILTQTSVNSGKRIRLAIAMIAVTAVACLSNMVSMAATSGGSLSATALYVIRAVRHLSLSSILLCYIYYLEDPLWIPTNLRKLSYTVTISALVITLITDVSLSLNGIGYHVDANGEIFSGTTNVYTYLFMLYLGIIFYRIIRYRKRIIRKIYWCMLFSNLMCMVMMAVQGRHHQTSFTTVAFFMPVICLIFMFHSNQYDTDTGALSEKFFHEDLTDSIEKKKALMIVSFYISNFFNIMKDSTDLQHEYRVFFHQNFQRGTAYRFTNDRLLYVFPKKSDLQKDKILSRLVNDFLERYGRFNIDYKITVVETTSDISDSQDYVRLITFSENKTEQSSIYYVTKDDVKQYYNNDYVLRELEDIAHRKDLNDPRVIVYCQPVFNISTNKYDTAEALMRLKLEDIGIVYPDQFIPIAEQNGLIHTMSLIILNKTCIAIRNMIEQGYHLERISVNFSTSDLRHDSFCDEVKQIITQNEIPLDKIAIEITESRNDSDFNIMIQKVTQLQKLGIKFYLDDFGTGYSNFERIMEIPFDIIKFDRSMLIESNKSDNSFYMVATFAQMFSNLKYSVLFEGIENETDENNCRNMNAKYLQGYKYSKPIPIEHLSDFLSN